MKTPPLRDPANTSLTISLPKDLKAHIEAAAAADRRKVSPWLVIQLEKILDHLDGTTATASTIPANRPSSKDSAAVAKPGPPTKPVRDRRSFKQTR